MSKAWVTNRKKYILGVNYSFKYTTEILVLYILGKKAEPASLGLCPDLPVHDGCSGDAAGQWVNLKQAAHGWWPDGVGHLAILTLV